MWLISRGHTSESLKSITLEHKAALLHLTAKGVIGFVAEGVQQYRNLHWLESIRSTVIALGGGKKVTPHGLLETIPELSYVGVPERPKQHWRDQLGLKPLHIKEVPDG